jgi:parallel beta-helix repeat protein
MSAGCTKTRKYPEGEYQMNMNHGIIRAAFLVFVLSFTIMGIVAAVSTGDNTSFPGNTVVGKNEGIFLVNSGNNTLAGNIVTGNTMSGIRLVSSDNNTLTGNLASKNAYGITLVHSDNNTVTGNNVSSNTLGGIRVIQGSRNNLIVNNSNNINNTPGDSSINATSWEIPPVSGTSITGGPETGGNFWGIPDGRGCTV